MRPPLRLLAAAAGAAAASAAVAAAVSGHDAAAEAAAGGVAQVDQARQGVGGVDGAGSGLSASGFRTARSGSLTSPYAFRLMRYARRPQAEVLEQHLLLAGQEAQLEPAEDVIHDRLGIADVGIAAPSAGLEARVRELFAEQFQRDAMLQRDARRRERSCPSGR